MARLGGILKTSWQIGALALLASVIDGLTAGIFTLATAVLVLRLRRPDRSQDEAQPALGGREALLAMVDDELKRDSSPPPLVLVLDLDRARDFAERLDVAAQEQLRNRITAVLGAVIRPVDRIAALDLVTWAVAIRAGHQPHDLTGAMQVAARFQTAVSDGVAPPCPGLAVSVSVGFALPVRVGEGDAARHLQAARLAAIEAHRSGPSAIRSYSSALLGRLEARDSLVEELQDAFESGQIVAWFQPQTRAATGEISGVEALARWRHPIRGLVPTAEFLPALKTAGLMPRLGQEMIAQSLAALAGWDESGLTIPAISVNFSTEELCDPGLVDRIAFDLDRAGLSPDRLVIEVLETVVAQTIGDPVIRNLAGLARLGCRIDLDDFGTGHAAITSIRRFHVERIKIDRSFVTGIDTDPEQQKMVGAILTMAERLDLATLAEGVETETEAQMLARLGCAHLQGYGIGRPMPKDALADWVRLHRGDHPAAIPLRPDTGLLRSG